MRKCLFILISGLIFILQLNLPAQQVSPQRFEILGAIVGGAELINGVVKLIISNKTKENVVINTNVSATNFSSSTNLSEEDKAKKEEELKKLLAPSKLFDIINSATNKNQTSTNMSLPLMSVISNTNKRPFLIINNTNKMINILIHTNQNLTNHLLPISPGINILKTTSTNKLKP